jgi:hypothetical protein
MQTLSEILQQPQARPVALSHFNVCGSRLLESCFPGRKRFACSRIGGLLKASGNSPERSNSRLS